MIQKILIKNYQSHKESELIMDPGVNIIIGASDSGKTAIIRALRWAIWNKPSGNSMRSHWGGKTSVEIITDDCRISRSKDKEELYTLGDSEFKAFRTEVPEEIQKALNMSEINLQRQLDNPFLISETSGNVAQHFNKVAKLDSIDKGLQNINSSINQLNSTIGKEAVKDKPATGLIKQINDKQKELAGFAYLEKFEIEVEVLEELDKQYNTTVEKERKLKILLINIEDVSTKIDQYKDILELEKPVEALLKLFEEKQAYLGDHLDLESLISLINNVDVSIKEVQALTELENPVNSLLKLYNNLEIAENNEIKLSKTLSTLESINTSIESKTSSIKALEVEFKEGMGSICLLCGSKLK